MKYLRDRSKLIRLFPAHGQEVKKLRSIPVEEIQAEAHSGPKVNKGYLNSGVICLRKQSLSLPDALLTQIVGGQDKE